MAFVKGWLRRDMHWDLEAKVASSAGGRSESLDHSRQVLRFDGRSGSGCSMRIGINTNSAG